MGRARTYEALVLRTYDVGEADRFCILLTRERGRLAARARGVRKLKSRLGGTLLPMNHAHLELHEGSAGFLITGAQLIRTFEVPKNLNNFMHSQQATELLLALLQDDEPVPEILDATLNLLTLKPNQPNQPNKPNKPTKPNQPNKPTKLLSYTLHLLSLLGLLPTTTDSNRVQVLNENERAFLEACASENWMEAPSLEEKEYESMKRFCKQIMDEQTSRALKTDSILD
jgi:recombinational DNA repair protein (RecF pathway)